MKMKLVLSSALLSGVLLLVNPGASLAATDAKPLQLKRIMQGLSDKLQFIVAGIA